LVFAAFASDSWHCADCFQASAKLLGKQETHMKFSDPIADLLTRIRNGQKAGRDVVNVPASKMKISIAHILREEGFIKNYKCIRDNQQGVLKIALKYSEDGAGAIRELKRQSTPSRRIYRNSEQLNFVRNGFGIGIYSTSRGIVTDREARRLKVGGEYICSVF
jgi:small subunit ribosomal protein S8